MDLTGLDVSRETLDRLDALANLVQKWTKKINLISRGSHKDIWERHIVDSAQIYSLVEPKGSWVDIGSGGGFPGLVVAVLAAEAADPMHVTLVESDVRKSVFLRTAARQLDLKVHVLSERIEILEPLQADILSARALADLPKLLSFADRHLSPNGIALFPKGENWKNEHEAARSQWSYECEAIKSQTNPRAAILKIKDIARV